MVGLALVVRMGNTSAMTTNNAVAAHYASQARHEFTIMPDYALLEYIEWSESLGRTPKDDGYLAMALDELDHRTTK